MKKIAFAASVIMLLGTSQVFAQTKIKKDTIYYMLDLDKVAPKDRIVGILPSGDSKVVEIPCGCLVGTSPKFYLNILNTKPISEREVKKIKFISLIRFIRIIQHDYSRLFHAGHDVFFIEPDGKNFKITPGELMYYDADPIEPE